MSDDLKLWCKAMDGVWEVAEVRPAEGAGVVVLYRSADYPEVTWSHVPLHPEIAPAVGTRGRLGFIPFWNRR